VGAGEIIATLDATIRELAFACFGGSPSISCCAFFAPVGQNSGLRDFCRKGEILKMVLASLI
jgi:hypothetical protein